MAITKIPSLAAAGELLISPVLITKNQVWVNQIQGAYNLLFPLINDDFRFIEDEDAQVKIMAAVADTDPEYPAPAPFLPYMGGKAGLRALASLPTVPGFAGAASAVAKALSTTNVLGLKNVRPDPVLGRVHRNEDPTHTSQVVIANQGAVL